MPEGWKPMKTAVPGLSLHCPVVFVLWPHSCNVPGANGDARSAAGHRAQMKTGKVEQPLSLKLRTFPEGRENTNGGSDA